MSKVRSRPLARFLQYRLVYKPVGLTSDYRIMVSFSKFINGQRDAQLLLDTDGFLYARRKDRDTLTSTTWRCQKYRIKKCKTTVVLDRADQTLSSNEEPHTHEPDAMVAEKAEFRQSLKRKSSLSLEKSNSPERSPVSLIFQQSYSLHAVIDGKCIPLVFALLSDKTLRSRP